MAHVADKTRRRPTLTLKRVDILVNLFDGKLLFFVNLFDGKLLSLFNLFEVNNVCVVDLFDKKYLFC